MVDAVNGLGLSYPNCTFVPCLTCLNYHPSISRRDRASFPNYNQQFCVLPRASSHDVRMRLTLKEFEIRGNHGMSLLSEFLPTVRRVGLAIAKAVGRQLSSRLQVWEGVPLR
jgi:hypothetical protein